jgi:hypothetical protein
MTYGFPRTTSIALRQGDGHRDEQVERFADVAEHGGGADREAAGQVGVGLPLRR